MPVQMENILAGYSPDSASGILAAAALSSISGDLDFAPPRLRRYAAESKSVLGAVRRQLHIAQDDFSPVAQASIDRALTEAIRTRFVPGNQLGTALSRAGFAGRVPPQYYTISQPKPFLEKFRTLAIRANHVERAIRECDDYQHPLAAEAAIADKDAVSLFIREATMTRSGARHWLLIQTHRSGLVQVVQSAWHVYSDDVDLDEARQPLDVLRAFAKKFGLPMHVEGRRSELFVEKFITKKTSHIKWGFKTPSDFHANLSYTDTSNPDEIQIGIGYCIDLVGYRLSLRDHGLMTNDEMMGFNQMAKSPASAPVLSLLSNSR